MTHEFEQLIDAIKSNGLIPQDAKVFVVEMGENGHAYAQEVKEKEKPKPDPNGAIIAINDDLRKYWAERGEAIAEHYGLTLNAAEAVYADHCINFGSLLGARLLGVRGQMANAVAKDSKNHFLKLCHFFRTIS